MRYLTKAHVKQNQEIDADLRAKRICAACGSAFSRKVKRSKHLNDVCENCERSFD